MGEEDCGIPDIERVPVSEEDMRAFDEEHFNELSVRLGVEFGSWVCVAASLLPGDTRAWNRDQAILGGLMVRFFKLVSGILDQTCQHRRETTFILSRLGFECIINVRYLILHDSAEIYAAFIASSLRHEKRLRERIEANIRARGGVVLPIEERMLTSIDKSIAASGFTVADVTREAMRPWADVDLYQRAEAVGLGQAYLYVFAGPSHSVHGSWQDLLEYHLEGTESGFEPQLMWNHPRPQMLFALCLLGVEMVQEYMSHIAGERATGLIACLDDLTYRLDLANRSHEAYITKRQIEKMEV